MITTMKMIGLKLMSMFKIIITKKCDNISKQDVSLEINKIIIQDTYNIKNSSSNKREIAIITRVLKIMIIEISIIKISIITTMITAIIISVISICH